MTLLQSKALKKFLRFIGKKKRVGRIMGEKRSWKKAIVTLAPGNRIEIHEGV
jgi:large subunit ribosomal protein L23